MYGGTKTEMERLLADAEKLPAAMGKDFDISNYSDIIEAIHLIQTEMGITGTTALEAGRTISGSVGSMKAAWANLLTGLSSGNADVEQLVSNLVTSIVGDGTKNNLGVLGNVMPAIKNALNGSSKLIRELLPAIVQEIPSIINDNLPILAEAAISIIQSLVDGISENQEMLIETAMETMTFLIESLLSMLPQILQLGLDLIVSLADGISSSLPALVPTIVSVLLKIVDVLTNPATLSNILRAALAIITELAWGLINNIDGIIDAAFILLDGIIDFLLDPKNLMMLVNTAIELVLAIGVGIIKARPKLLVSVGSLIHNIYDTLTHPDWSQIGKDLVSGFKKGIENAWKSLKTWFTGLFDDLIGIAKRILGIASPSKVFKKIGGFTAEGFGAGFEDEFDHVKADMEDALDFNDASFGIDSSIRHVMADEASGIYGSTTISGVEINIYADQAGDSAESIADAVALALQDLVDRRSAVYA